MVSLSLFFPPPLFLSLILRRDLAKLQNFGAFQKLGKPKILWIRTPLLENCKTGEREGEKSETNFASCAKKTQFYYYFFFLLKTNQTHQSGCKIRPHLKESGQMNHNYTAPLLRSWPPLSVWSSSLLQPKNLISLREVFHEEPKPSKYFPSAILSFSLFSLAQTGLLTTGNTKV